MPGSSIGAVTTFVVGLDASGAAFAAFPVTRTSRLEGSSLWLGADLTVDESGDLLVVAASRDGRILLGGAEENTSTSAFEIVVARVDAAGEARWAQRCAATLSAPASPAPTPADLSARSGGIVALPGGELVVAASTALADAVTCDVVVGDPPCPSLTIPQRQGGVVLRFDRGGGACAGAGVAIHGEGASVVVLDDVDTAGDDAVRVSGHVSQSATLLPWGAALDGGATHAFAALLEPATAPSADHVRSFLSTGHPAYVAEDGRLLGATPSGVPFEGAFPASDLHLVDADGASVPFGDPDDETRVEVATSFATADGFALVTGHLTEDGSLADDVCTSGCAGDLSELDPCAAPSAGDVDAFWLLLPDERPGEAVGRAFGGCGRQTITAGTIGDDGTFVLAASVDGMATLDVLDGTVDVVSPALQRSAVIARMKVPTAVRGP